MVGLMCGSKMFSDISSQSLQSLVVDWNSLTVILPQKIVEATPQFLIGPVFLPTSRGRFTTPKTAGRCDSEKATKETRGATERYEGNNATIHAQHNATQHGTTPT